MVNVSLLKRVIEGKFGDSQPAGEDIRVNCPFCILRGRQKPDTEHKLYINPTKDVAHCFRCDYASKASKLIPQVASFGVALDKVPKQNGGGEDELEGMPDNCSLDSLPDDHLALTYLRDRKFNPFDFLERMVFCPDYKKNNYSFGPRLIFPIFQSGTYRGFQARTIWKNTEPKYTGATNMKKKTLLYNYDEAFSQDEQLIVTEGFFDVLRIGNQAVGAFGKAISDEQLRLIRMGRFKRVVMLLDPDAKKEGLESANELARDFNTYVGLLKDKDPGEMTKVELDGFMKNQLRRVY